jgi:hypothetical protein
MQDDDAHDLDPQSVSPLGALSALVELHPGGPNDEYGMAGMD